MNAMPPNVLEPDAEEISRFVRTLFLYADDGGYVSLRAFDQFRHDVPPILIRPAYVNGAGLDAVISEAVRAARESDNTARPAVFAPPICTFINASRARVVDLENGLVLSVEIDEGDTTKARLFLESMLGPATVTVASGSDWTDPETGEVFPKLHLHWRLSEPTRDAEDHARLRQARNLAALLVGADPTGKPVVHPLRWPGSWNRKTTPRMARIVAYNETAEIHLGEALEKLEEAAAAAGCARAGMPRSGTPEAPIPLVADAMRAIPNADADVHYADWVRLGYACFRATGGTDDGFAIWDEWSKKSDKYDADETEATWKRIDHAIGGSKAPPSTVGAGTIFYEAARHGWKRSTANADDAGPQRDHAEARAEPPPPLLDPWDALQPLRFPMRALPAVLRAFVENRARVMGADAGALAWAAISACGTALDASIRLQMKRHDTWTVPSFIWLALVGAPSTKKSPILDVALYPLERAQEADIDEWKARLAIWKALPKKERDKQPEPVCKRRLVTKDPTIEAMEEILGRQDRGICLFRDELPGWIGSLEKYTSRHGSAADRAFYLTAFNGTSYIVDRIGRGTTPIKNLSIPIVGGVQPDRLRQLGDITADGLWQRFLSIIVGPASLGCDDADLGFGPLVDYNEMVERLLDVPPETRMTLSAEAHAVREDVANRLFELEQNLALGPSFSAFCGKLIGIWGRLCLILSQVEPDRSNPLVVPERIASAAEVLLFKSVLPNAGRVYAGMGGGGGNIEVTQAIAGFILTKHKERLLASDLSRNVRACRGAPLEDIQRLVSPLVAGGWLTPESDLNPSLWTVHPEVHQRFAKRGVQETTRRAAIREIILNPGDDE